MNHERLERAVFAAEVRRKGTLLSDEAVADVCEALLEVADEGTITLELHEQLLGKAIDEKAKAEAEAQRLEALRVQSVAMGQSANRRISELEAEVARLKSQDKTEMYANAWERELGPPFVAKTHRIDSLVLTTRLRMGELARLRAEAAAPKSDRPGGAPRGPELDEVLRSGGRD